jgi:hypothetical protein
MAYTTINKSSDYFNTKLYTGNGSTNAITGVGHQPDFVWIKQRSGTEFHQLANVIQGVGKQVCANADEAESTIATGLTAFGADGFTVGASGNYNNNGGTFASWNWKAGGGQGSSNTAGSINTTYTSVNTTAGFSISSYTGTGSNATVGHGLGVVPKMIIIKKTSATADWMVYHHSLGNNKHLHLNTTDAQANGQWNSTTPTSSVFSVDGDQKVNQSSATYIAYCFAEKQGYSKVRSYIGNGNADGPFIYTGFKPAFVITKKTNSTSVWTMFDNKRDPFNYVRRRVAANSSAAENTDNNQDFDILSNGFKPRRSAGDWNSSGDTFIYMAFAEAPLVGSNNVPCTAR